MNLRHMTLLAPRLLRWALDFFGTFLHFRPAKWVRYFIDFFGLCVFCASVKRKFCVCPDVYVMYIVYVFMYNVCNISI